MAVPIMGLLFPSVLEQFAGSGGDAGGGDARGFHQLARGPGAGQPGDGALPDPQRQAGPGERLEDGGAEAALG